MRSFTESTWAAGFAWQEVRRSGDFDLYARLHDRWPLLRRCVGLDWTTGVEPLVLGAWVGAGTDMP